MHLYFLIIPILLNATLGASTAFAGICTRVKKIIINSNKEKKFKYPLDIRSIYDKSNVTGRIQTSRKRRKVYAAIFSYFSHFLIC